MKRWLAGAVLACGVSVSAQQVPRPLLVSVDDLPMGSGGLHKDAAERSTTTDALLAVLRKHKVPAVGLVTWGNLLAPAEEGLLERWLTAGFELGNHTVHHKNYTNVSIEEYQVDAEDARARLAAFLAPRGKTLRFFRFPFLCEGDTPEKLQAMRAWLAKTGQRNLPVTIDNQDWSYEGRWMKATQAGDVKAQEEVRADYLASLRVAVRHAEAGSEQLFGRPVPQILLLHANAVGAANWDALFSWLEASGHRFATADEVLADPAFAEPEALVARFGYGLWDRIDTDRHNREVRDAVAALLTAQAEAWNRGDLAAFCGAYAEDATFASPSGLIRGRQRVLDQYLKKYPDAAARGSLAFEVLDTQLAQGTEITIFDDAVPSDVHGVSVLARWTLSYAGKPAVTGLTQLALRPRQKSWEIVQDASF
jgi:peptidoglycan/xylan/chitin deacetylase (PgdA/CDA1 family)